jgi:hypothetical protein
MVAWQGHDVKENVSVANNACWAIGEVAIKVKTCFYIFAHSFSFLYPKLKHENP